MNFMTPEAVLTTPESVSHGMQSQQEKFSTEAIESAVALSRRFYSRAMRELGKIAMGEDEAKIAVLLAPVTGNATMLAGPPAGGKSKLGRYGTNVIAGIDADHTAFVPPMMDMTQQQFAGGEVRTWKKADDNDWYQETTLIEGIVKPNTRKIFGDETPRQNPYVQNSSLSIAEEGVLLTSKGEIPLNEMIAYIGTMNAADAGQGSIKPSKAFAARHGIGVLVGKTMSRDDKAKALKLRYQGEWESRPQDVKSVIDIPGVNTIRSLVRDIDAIGMDEDLQDHFAELSIRAEEALEDYTGEEVWRIDGHAQLNARALAAFDGKQVLEEKHVNKGMKYALLGRVVILSTGKASDIKKKADSLVHDVVGKSV